MEDYVEKLRRCNDYIEKLDEERKKIEMFRRELPLCLELVTQAIERCRLELTRSVDTSDDGPVLEEFMPIKTNSFSDDGDDGDEEEEESVEPDSNTEKSDWLRSVQLWSNQTLALDPSHKEDSTKKESVKEVKKTNGSGFRAFRREKKEKSPAQEIQTVTTGSSSAGTETGRVTEEECKKEDKAGESRRKKRRCWSPELHRRFLNALQQLGGLHVATPKQIREFMKVDGLTNDEVKSHLQKYRLHTRRPSSNNNGNNINNNSNQPPPQFVVVGGIWVHPPPPENTQTESPVATGVTTGPGVYAPVALLPQAKHNCTSSSASSTHTTTVTSVF